MILAGCKVFPDRAEVDNCPDRFAFVDRPSIQLSINLASFGSQNHVQLVIGRTIILSVQRDPNGRLYVAQGGAK